jgi:cell division protein FtsZ
MNAAPEREAPAAPRRAEEPTLATGQRASEPAARQPEPAPARESAWEARTQVRPQAARPEARPEPESQRESSQPRLSGLDPADRHDPAQEDDQLDIPAFLRRQAN